MVRDPFQVAILVYDELSTFEFGIMVELFGRARPEFDRWYSLRVCSLERGPVRAAGGILIEARHGLSALDRAGTIIIPGWRQPLDEVPTALVRKLVRAHAQGARLLSVCTGVFALAATGLLEGLRVTTHWMYAEQLSAAYPGLMVNPDVLYVDEGRILSSAGSAAGIDLGLHLIRRDLGAEVANVVARRLVVSPHRDGGQQQFIATPVDQGTRDGAFSTHLQEVRLSLAEPHSVESMARRACMSPRTFARRFKAATGTTPHRWLVRERIQQSQALLETSDLGLDAIASRLGLCDAQLLRLHFRQIVGTTPSAYRRAFRATKSSSTGKDGARS